MNRPMQTQVIRKLQNTGRGVSELILNGNIGSGVKDVVVNTMNPVQRTAAYLTITVSLCSV